MNTFKEYWESLTNEEIKNLEIQDLVDMMKFYSRGMKCKYCKKDLPNKQHRTKNGCKWCDYDYRVKKIKEESKNG